MMIDRLKVPFIVIGSCFLFCYATYKTFRYFIYHTPPVIELQNIANNGTYAGKATGTIYADNAYKISSIQVLLDGKTIIEKRIKSCHVEEPLTIDTTILQQGLHNIDIVADDTSYHNNKIQKRYQFYIDNLPLRVTLEKPEHTVDQGKTLHIKLQANKRNITAQTNIFGTTYTFYPADDNSSCYECFIPVGSQEPAQEHVIGIDMHDAVGNSIRLPCKATVLAFEFKKQRGFTVSEEKLAQEKEASMSSKVLNEALERWVKDSPKKKLWAGPFDYPVDIQRISTPFGEIRVTPERGRYMHCGIDLISRPRCVVWAAQNGKVIIKDRFFLTGNTIVLDHGLGVFTLYAHLEEYADIQVGDMLKKGNPVGKLGMTGYATGYHLHWELRVNNTPVDPTEWTNKVF